jgi:periplasmic protein TonB
MSNIINNQHKQKKVLFFLFIAIAMFSVISCNNDSNSDAKLAKDSAATAVPDTVSKAVTKTKKGKASAMMMADNTVKMEKDKDGVYNKTEVMPVYPGGETALSSFIGDNITYPQDAVDQNTEGTATVTFVVDEKGKVTNPVITGKPVGHGLDEEAVKVVSKMPAWKPGMIKGKAVKTRLQLPVTFKLSD